jgi:hypothetical protein
VKGAVLTDRSRISCEPWQRLSPFVVNHIIPPAVPFFGRTTVHCLYVALVDATTGSVIAPFVFVAGQSCSDVQTEVSTLRNRRSCV